MIKGFLKIEVLLQLQLKDLTGYELMKKIGEETGKKPSAGSIYPLMKELLDKKIISVKVEGRRKIYTLTKFGNDELKEIVYEKQTTALQSIEVIKRFGKFTGEDAISSIISHFEKLNYYPILMTRLIDVTEDIEDVLMRLFKAKKYDSNETLIRKELNKTVQKLNDLLED